ncbi:MAG: hypothetical protein IJZ51_09330 [Ruminiclostridium sp.]|nr:hypothetical protein [Ruminiclostridium sp.]
MKKLLSVILSIMMLQILVIPSYADGNVVTDAPSRVINLVFDDSASMFRLESNGKFVYYKTWCQAWYALEVFTAMMGSNDRMNVYFLNDNSVISIDGAKGAETNVREIHNAYIRFNAGTPFTRVKQAYNDLTQTSADEKWLVVLTDGAFDENRDDTTAVNNFYHTKSSDINIMTLEIGDVSNNIKVDENKGIFLQKAKESKQILEEVINICTRIFNTDRLPVSAYTKKISFDVPMGELTIFAQGENVQINGITKLDGTAIRYEQSSVEVKHQESSAVKRLFAQYNVKEADDTVDTSLVGQIATFKGDFSSGDYELDVTGAETIEVYYKPNIDIAVYIKDANGNEVTNLAELEAGEYTMEFGFVKGGTKEVIPPSELLGDVKYEAKVTNNGNEHSRTYSSGDKIRLEKGDLSIEVVGRYLKYNSISTRLSYNIFMKNEVTFEVIDDPQYVMLKEGFESTPPIKVKAFVEGREITADEWQQMDVPVVSPGMSLTLGDFRVEKSETVGVYNIYPAMKGEKPSLYIQYGDSSYNIDYKGEVNGEEWSGKHDATVKIKEERSGPEIYPDLFIVLLVIAGIIAIILGYMPFIKCYLPRALKKYPLIVCRPVGLGGQKPNSKGRIEKSKFSTYFPYIPQTATITFVPRGVSAPKMKVVALRGGFMEMKNQRMFSAKRDIKFNGSNAPESGKFPLSGVTTVQTKTPAFIYECSLAIPYNRRQR